MWELEYTVTLLSDVVISANAATLGGHLGLDHLPGSCFLGATASRALQTGNGFDPQLFLSGRVRFLDAYPEVDGRPTVPIPLSFHRLKGEGWKDIAPHNPLAGQKPAKGQQAEQWRDGFMSLDGTVVREYKQIRMKTAIDRSSRRSAEAQLFGYQSIPAGMVFRLRVQADSQTDLNLVRQWLDVGHLRLGRSRSAEYGSVRLDPPNAPSSPPDPIALGDRVVIYLLTDLALHRNGMPVLTPEGADFSLPTARVVPAECWIRTRAYSPWNSYFHCLMPERQVLGKGSIITLTTAAAEDPAVIQRRLSGGVGLYREEGLGQVWVNPPWLWQAPKLSGFSPPKAPPAPDPDTPLTRFLRDRSDLRRESARAFRNGLEWAVEWHRLSVRLARENPKVPGKTQWAAVRELAIRYRHTPAAFPAALRTFCGEDLRRKLWQGAALTRAGKSMHLLGAIEEKVGETPDRLAVLAVYHASVEMGRKLSRGDNQSGDRKS